MKMGSLLLVVLLAGCAGPPRPAPPSDSARLSLGPIATDVGVGSALLWARATAATTLSFELEPADALIAPIRIDESRDFTGRVRLDGLRPATEYQVRVRTASGSSAEGSFKTPPAPNVAAPVRIAWGGDVAGQNVCRDARTGFPIFGALAGYRPDVFIGLGDMIYADNRCEARGLYGNEQLPGGFAEATDLASYWAHWRYAREDTGLAKLLARTPYVPVWDDHEVVNDFGPLQDTRAKPPYTEGVHLMPIGLEAFLDYNPVTSDSSRTPKRLYRALRLGKHVELFVLDTRQYRDANLAPDEPPAPADDVGAIRRAKSMLGREQLTWLESALAASDATWKVIVSSVPLGAATGFPSARGRDGWAGVDQDTGFARERDEILRFLADRGVSTPIWITTDVHIAEVFVHRPFADRPEFRVVEAISGPLNAGVGMAQPIDPQLRSEIRFLHAPTKEAPIRGWDEALGYFNFGALEVAADGSLTLRIVATSGATLYEERFIR
jgi:alkaline phosphatase D